MRIHKEYRKLENVEEVNVYDVHEKEFYIQAPKEFEMENIPFPVVMKNIKTDINIFVPYKDGEDFIIHGLGNSALKRGNIQQEDIEGRLLSKASPMFHQLLHESLFEVYKTHEIKHMRFLYHHKEKLARLTNVKIIYEMGRIFILSDHIDTSESTLYIPEDENRDEDKANLIEYFAQTGSYYKINGKYSWTQGIYNIINRPRDEYDEYYNIIFDLTIPEDKPLVEKINKIMDSGTSHYESIIRIRTHDGTLKYLEMNLYSKFDDNGNSNKDNSNSYENGSSNFKIPSNGSDLFNSSKNSLMNKSGSSAGEKSENGNSTFVSENANIKKMVEIFKDNPIGQKSFDIRHILALTIVLLIFLFGLLRKRDRSS